MFLTSVATTPPSTPVPVPNGIIAMWCWLHNLATPLTSSVLPGHTTRSGGWILWYDSSFPCCSLTACEVEMFFVPTIVVSSSMIPSTFQIKVFVKFWNLYWRPLLFFFLLQYLPVTKVVLTHACRGRGAKYFGLMIIIIRLSIMIIVRQRISFNMAFISEKFRAINLFR